MSPTLLALALLGAPPGLFDQVNDGPQIIGLVQFQADPETWERFHRRSQSDPLTLEQLEELAAAGVAPRAIIELMRTRRVMVLANAETLVRLKKAGASDDVITAVSAYALPPNKTLDLLVSVDLITPYSVARAPTLYIELWNHATGAADAFLHADLKTLLRGGWKKVEVVHDDSDPLLPTQVRSLRFAAPVRVRKPGRVELRVLASQRAGLTTLANLPADDAKRLRTFEIEYPSVSIERTCRLDLGLGRDPLLERVYNVLRSDLRCHWE